jgi:hypothetical protein
MGSREPLGLSVVDGRLWLRESRRRGARLRLEPSGVVVLTGSEESLLAWGSYLPAVGAGDGWGCSGVPGSRYNRPAVTVVSERRPDKRFDLPRMTQWSVPSPWLSLRYAWAEFPALVAYLAATPGAWEGLQNADRLSRLVDEFKSGPTFERPLPGPHGMGNKLDIDNAIHKVFAVSGVRMFGGRPVRGEPLPTPSELVPPVRDALPRLVKERSEDEEIERRIGRFLHVRAWPFDCLVTASPAGA